MSDSQNSPNNDHQSKTRRAKQPTNERLRTRLRIQRQAHESQQEAPRRRFGQMGGEILPRQAFLPRLGVNTTHILNPTANLPRPGVIVQPMMSVNAPNDQYEVEANRVPDAVMRMPTGPIGGGWGKKAPTPAKHRLTSAFQRQNNLLARSADNAPPEVTPDIENRMNASEYQPGTTAVNEPNDQYEQSADQVTDQVMRSPQEVAVPDTQPEISTVSAPEPTAETQAEPVDETVAEVEAEALETEAEINPAPETVQTKEEEPKAEAPVSEPQKEEQVQSPATEQIAPEAAQTSGETAQSETADAAAEEATGIASQRPNLISASLQTLVGVPPTAIFEILTPIQQNIPTLLQQEQQALADTLPTELKTPLGIPTLNEATKVSAPLADGAAEPLTAPAAAPVQPQTPQAQGNPVAERQAAQSQRQEVAQEKDETRQAGSSRMQSQTQTNTSAGKRPKVDLTGKADPSQMQQKQMQSDMEAQQVMQQATQNATRDFGENDLYPEIERASVPLPTPAIEMPEVVAPSEVVDASWAGLTAQLADNPQLETMVTNRQGQLESTIAQADEAITQNEQKQTLMVSQQEEISAVVGQMQASDMTQVDEQMQTRMTDWLSQEGTVVAHLDEKFAAHGEVVTQAQGQLADAQGTLSQLPDPAMLASRMGESEQMRTTVDTELMPEFEAKSAEMIAQHEAQRAAVDAQVNEQWSQSQQMLADHEAQQQAKLAEIQATAQTEVAQAKSDWQAQNKGVMADYRIKAETARQHGDQTVQQAVAKGEQEASQILSKGEAKANATKAENEEVATDLVQSGREKAASHLGGANLRMDGQYESKAVHTIIQRQGPDTAAREEAARRRREAERKAKEQAEREMREAIRLAQLRIELMRKEVERILADATLSALEKVQQVNDIVQQAIQDVNDIIETAKAAIPVRQRSIEVTMEQNIKNSLNNAVETMSNLLLADEAVATRVADIKTDIALGRGNILLDGSNLGKRDGILFQLRMREHINTLMERPAGLELIMGLMDGDHTVTITADKNVLAHAVPVDRNDAKNGTGSDSRIFINQKLEDSDIVGFDADRNDIPFPVWVHLGHELIHARNIGQGRIDLTSKSDYSNKEEYNAIDGGDITENDLREQFGLSEPRYGHNGRLDNDPRLR